MMVIVIATLLLSSLAGTSGAAAAASSAAPLEVKEFSFADELNEAFVVAMKSKSKGASVGHSSSFLVPSRLSRMQHPVFFPPPCRIASHRIDGGATNIVRCGTARGGSVRSKSITQCQHKHDEDCVSPSRIDFSCETTSTATSFKARVGPTF